MKSKACFLEDMLQNLGKNELIELLLHLRSLYSHFDFETLNWLKAKEKKATL
jgi:hypothetical protein